MNGCMGRPVQYAKSPLMAAMAPARFAMDEVVSNPPDVRRASPTSSESAVLGFIFRTKMCSGAERSMSVTRVSPGAICRVIVRYFGAVAPAGGGNDTTTDTVVATEAMAPMRARRRLRMAPFFVVSRTVAGDTGVFRSNRPFPVDAMVKERVTGAQ